MFLPDLATRVFADGGALCDALKLEHRAGQEQMAISVAQAYATDSSLFVEAPTGVGKSLAYLVPGIVHAMAAGRQLLVSTNTKALQEQIRGKDLELCRRLFSLSEGLGGYGSFKAAVLMGRGNYLCGTRLREALKGGASLFPSAYETELLRIEAWSKSTQTGLLSELLPQPMDEIWEHLSADSPACNNRNCTPETCPYRRARREVETANLLIVNHSLLFSLLGAGFHPAGDTPGILHAADFAVLDEAHTVPSVATEHFGAHVSDYAIRRQLLRLYNPTTRKGLLPRHAGGEGVNLVEKALRAVSEFFAQTADRYLLESDIVRLPSPGWTEDSLKPVLAEVVSVLSSQAQRMGDAPAKDELQGAADLVASYMGAVAGCIALEEKNHVYWTERTGRGRIISLNSAPLDVAPYLRERLFSRQTAVVLTSATLGSGDGMEAFVSRTGGHGARLESVDSPFDFSRQMRVYVAEGAPAPEEGRIDIEWMAEIICHCVTKVRGGSLVLFTSHKDMRAASVKVMAACEAAKRPFFMQGTGNSPMALRESFAAAGNGILFGTDSFWTGIDVPGRALSQVIVTRLPFENPTHPIAQARSQWLQARGENPFACLTLPDAVIKFRQGIGRLIRNRTDLGTVTVLDSRILTRQYGKFFLSVLPNRDYKRFTAVNVRERFMPLEA
ncbi:MAG TPA: ATP-dependent DNA helicase [Opitutales bacterium]|nr:ATP-dependent DNA helicase [Opitutales bacterium]